LQNKLLRELVIASSAALLLATLDLVGVFVLVPGPFGSLATAAHFWLCAAGALATLFLACQALWAVISLATARLSAGGVAPEWAWVPVVVAAAALLNSSYAGTRTVFYVGLLLAAGLFGAAIAWTLSRVGSRVPRLAVAGGWLTAAAVLFALDAANLRGLYLSQHLTVGLLTWAATQAGLRLALPKRRPAKGLLALAVPALLSVVVLWATPEDAVSQNLKHMVHSAGTSSREALHLLSSVADADRDGYSGLLGGGDCAPLDGDIHPGAIEVPGDGVDGNCLGGDPAAQPPGDTFAVQPAATSYRFRSVVLITVDALRYDRVAGPGADPALSELWATGAAFSYAYCPFPGTILSLYSTMASVWPGRVELTPFRNFHVPSSDTATNLFEVLARAGVEARAVVYHQTLSPRFGITRGASSVWTAGSSGTEIVAGATTDKALEQLDSLAPGRFFLWVHYYDPHAPFVRDDGTKTGLAEERYDVEVARAGREVRRLVAGLEIRGLDRSTAVIVTADHGEEFGDHGAFFHGQAVYDESARVPFLVRAPGIAPTTVATPVSLIDLAPTVLDLLGEVESSPPEWQGSTLMPLLSDSGSHRARPVFIEAFQKGGEQRLHGVVSWPWKLVYRVHGHAFELYNLAQDSKEMLNVFDAVPKVAAGLAATLDRHLAFHGGPK